MAVLSRCVAISVPWCGAAVVHRKVDRVGLAPTVDFRSHPIGGGACMRASTAATVGIEDFAASERRVASTKTASSAAARRGIIKPHFRHSPMCKCTSWMRHLAQARNPYSPQGLWIPGSLALLAPRNDGNLDSYLFRP